MKKISIVFLFFTFKVFFFVFIVFSDDPIIKSGDNLQIAVLGVPDDLSANVVVSSSGSIFTQWIGEVQVAGLTPRQAEKVIAERLSKYFKNFQVSVYLVPPKPKFSIFGEVQKPGVYEILNPITLLEAISIAGGLTEKASFEVRITRGNKEVIVINLNDILQEGKVSSNINISPSDIVYIPEFAANYITIVGHVIKPGNYEMPQSRSPVDAIVLAGGLVIPQVVTSYGVYFQRSGTYQINIRRKALPPEVIYIDGANLSIIKSENEKEVLLEPGDTVYVREVKNSVIVLGEVASPKIYEFKIGDRITDAIALAGGFGKEPNIKEVGLIRYAGTKPVFMKIDMEKILKKGDIKQNIELQDKDIIYVAKRTRRIDWNKIVSKITSFDTVRDILLKWDID